MVQYVSWNIPSSELTLDIVWGNMKSIANHNLMKFGSDSICSQVFTQGNCSVDEWYNTVQAQVNLTRYPPETAKILGQGHILVLSMG